MTAITGSIGLALGSMAGGTFGWSAATWSQIGWTAGVLVGSYLFAPDGPDIVNEGPRLNDLKVTASTYGLSIPKLFGAYRISGNIIWALPLQEVRHEEKEEEGKGGGGGSTSTIWYTYNATFALALCEGPISGIRKIWFGSTLVYNNGIYGQGLRNTNVSIYNGTNTQEIDWIIHANRSDTPAYRNLAYIVFNTIELEDYGNIIPNVSCEVIKKGSSSIIKLEDILIPSMSSANIHHIDDNYIYSVGGYYDNTYTNVNYRFYRSPIYNDFNTKLLGVTYKENVICNEGNIDEYTCSINEAIHHSPVFPMYSDTSESTLMKIEGITYQQLNSGMSCCNIIPNITDYYSVDVEDSAYNFFLYNSDIYYFDKNNNTINKGYELSITTRTSQHWNTQNFSQIAIYNDVVYLVTVRPSDIEITKYTLLLNEIENIIISRGLTSYDEANYIGITVVDSDGIHIFRNIGYDKVSLNLIYIEYKSGLPFIRTTNGDIANFRDGILYKLTDTSPGVTPGTFNSKIERYSLDNINDTGSTLGSIFEELFLECGLSYNDFDISAANSVIVSGYVIQKNISVRASIEPLLSAYEYTLVEINHKIILRPQNQGIIETIYEHDFGANTDNKIEYNVKQEIDLMKSLTLKYANSISDYQTSTQQVRRIDTSAENEIVVELPLVLTDTEAKQLAEKTLYKNWVMRKSFAFSIPFIYNNLIPGDVIKIETEMFSEEVRLTDITITEDMVIDCKAVSNDSTTFISSAIGSNTSINYADLRQNIGPTDFYVLDIPTLHNNYINSEGVYIATTGYTNSWVGCSTYSKSVLVDDFSLDLNLIGTPVPIGTISNILLDGPTTVWDLINYIDVTCHIDLTTYSTTIESILLGNNYILIGNEILQFQTATDISILPTDNKYRLSILLRGRRGTENETNFHVEDEKFVFLNQNYTLGFIPKIISNTSYYNAISLKDSEISDTKELTYTGKNLKPFNISALHAKIVGTDIEIEWDRRSRYISGHLKKLPLSQTTEAYIISINNNIYNSSTSDFTYTSALMAIDGYTVNDDFLILVKQEGDHNSGENEQFILGDEYLVYLKSFNVILLYYLNEVNGSIPIEDSVNSYDGEFIEVGIPLFGEDPLYGSGTSIYFNYRCQIRIPQLPYTNSTSISIVLFAKPESALVLYHSYVTVNNRQLLFDSGGALLQYHDGINNYIIGAAEDEVCHIVAVWDIENLKMRLYINGGVANGGLQSETSILGPNTGTPFSTYDVIGYDGLASYGHLDNYSIINGALTEAEANTLYELTGF